MRNFTKRKSEIWAYPPLCKYHDQIDDFEQFVKIFNRSAESQDLCIYIHIPFCESFCLFCAYYKDHYFKYSMEQKRELIDAYKTEIAFYSKLPYFKNRKINAIHFGGGTPSCFDVDLLEEILNEIRQDFDFEQCQTISMEGNVKNFADLEKLKALKRLGITRVSFGIQTFDESIRKKIGIQAKLCHIYQAIENLKIVGIHDFAVDLIYNLPDQTSEILQRDLEQVDQLEASYIDVYNLNVYPNTEFYHLIEEDVFFHQKPSSDQEIAMFQQIIQFMEARGYHQVLVNTFSKVHHAPPLPTAMHLRSCLLGIGPSATSFLDDMNHKNIPDIQQYQERVRQNGCAVYIGNRATPEEIEERKLVLFPNYMQIDLDDNVDYERFEEIIEDLIAEGYLYKEGRILRLTAKGKLWPGNISAMFYNKKQQQKMQRSFFLGLQNRENLYNQDKMSVRPSWKGAQNRI